MKETEQINKMKFFTLENISDVWTNIRDCSSRGFHVFNDELQKMEFYTFADIYNQAGKMASYLSICGIGHGERVLVSAKTVSSFLSLWLALVWLGATPVPLPPYEGFFREGVFQKRIENIIPNFNYYICYEDEIPEIKKTNTYNEKNIKFICFTEIMKSIDKKFLEILPFYRIKSEDIAFIQYTSGSTKVPKGILITYKNLFTCIDAIWKELEVNPGTLKAASWLPLYHDMGLVGYFLGCMFTQTELYLFKPLYFAKRPLHFLSLLSRENIEISTMPNFALDWILKRYKPTKEYDFSLHSLKWLGIGAEPINWQTVQRFENTFEQYGLKKGVVSPCYGLAEATLAVSIAPPYEECSVVDINKREYITVGRILSVVDVKINKINENDIYGNILIRGDTVAKKALLHGIESEILDPEGFYNTKDIGCIIDDRLVILGRDDEMFVVYGENYFLHEIEDLIKENVKEITKRIVCLDVPVYESSESTSALIVLCGMNRRGEEEKNDILIKIDQTILHNTGIKAFEILFVSPNSIPITPSGKVKRYIARKRYLSGYYHHN